VDALPVDGSGISVKELAHKLDADEELLGARLHDRFGG
jgi:hypothetical protein